MQKLPTKLIGSVLLAPLVHGDERGFFLEAYRISLFAELGVTDEFVQDNHSRSRAGIARGMHFQPGQAKLVRCVRGAIYDVIVDIRPDSPQFGQWAADPQSCSGASSLTVTARPPLQVGYWRHAVTPFALRQDVGASQPRR